MHWRDWRRFRGFPNWVLLHRWRSDNGPIVCFFLAHVFWRAAHANGRDPGEADALAVVSGRNEGIVTIAEDFARDRFALDFLQGDDVGEQASRDIVPYRSLPLLVRFDVARVLIA